MRRQLGNNKQFLEPALVYVLGFTEANFRHTLNLKQTAGPFSYNKGLSRHICRVEIPRTADIRRRVRRMGFDDFSYLMLDSACMKVGAVYTSCFVVRSFFHRAHDSSASRMSAVFKPRCLQTAANFIDRKRDSETRVSPVLLRMR
jgi:hypothetical protein